jgi:hypothetical protein
MPHVVRCRFPDWRTINMLPLLSFHAIAATRGDGLRPELLALFERLAALPKITPVAQEPVSGDPYTSSAEAPDLPVGRTRAAVD